MKKLTSTIITALLLTSGISHAQFFNTPEELIYYTAEWQGERFPDGRPKVPD